MAVGGLVCLMCEPVDDDVWTGAFVATKIVGFALWGLTYLLYRYWDKQGLLPEENYDGEFIHRHKRTTESRICS